MHLTPKHKYNDFRKIKISLYKCKSKCNNSMNQKKYTIGAEETVAGLVARSGTGVGV